ncbi:chemotaxis protein CheX [Velocimicrobium porci]|uniref:Chemotaxis protein CheX n=1 Tax=Velocimicrobium porci TaxID=2606634 RepID=A0A6L5XVB6_9FIRM|nr:chemotaxis protein CheX [Velocimicrobium porci]MSS62780.1 chemotaxis protein CheX [Velocimicrobium porci]
MKQGVDVKYVNPFLQSGLSIFESMVQMRLGIGTPEVSSLKFENTTFLIQVGVTGEMKGQVLLAMTADHAKEIASRMMGGMEVAELDELSRSALGELSNMIMGNTATLFSNMGILIDITPPLSMLGNRLSLQADVQALKVPLTFENEEFISVYICVAKM